MEMSVCMWDIFTFVFLMISTWQYALKWANKNFLSNVRIKMIMHQIHSSTSLEMPYMIQRAPCIKKLHFLKRMTSQFSKTSFWNLSQTKNLFCLTRQHHTEISHSEKQAHFCHRSSIMFCTKYQENRKKSYLSKANKECVNISTECHKSIHKAAHVDPIQQLWIFLLEEGTLPRRSTLW